MTDTMNRSTHCHTLLNRSNNIFPQYHDLSSLSSPTSVQSTMIQESSSSNNPSVGSAKMTPLNKDPLALPAKRKRDDSIDDITAIHTLQAVDPLYFPTLEDGEDGDFKLFPRQKRISPSSTFGSSTESYSYDSEQRDGPPWPTAPQLPTQESTQEAATPEAATQDAMPEVDVHAYDFETEALVNKYRTSIFRQKKDLHHARMLPSSRPWSLPSANNDVDGDGHDEEGDDDVSYDFFPSIRRANPICDSSGCDYDSCDGDNEPPEVSSPITTFSRGHGDYNSDSLFEYNDNSRLEEKDDVY